MEDIKKIVKIAFEAALEEQASNIVVLDVHEQTIIADYFLIASGRNFIQVQNIIKSIEAKLEEHGVSPLRRDGQQQGGWVVLDYGSVLVHVFRQEEREFYGLEELWGDAEQVLINQEKS
ncbi:MAG TPA: ribosome silencing factor [Syntrophomonadaceae bacterium]|nr:ribosome silencing factor [Syntrophomonadaceae bacterium]